MSLSIGSRAAAAREITGERTQAGSPAGQRSTGDAGEDPQVFYFGVFDGHGGQECSVFLRDRLHEYIQDASAAFELQSSLRNGISRSPAKSADVSSVNDAVSQQDPEAVLPVIQEANRSKIGDLEKSLVTEWKDLVGGYFRRFQPSHFSFFGKKEKEPLQSEPAASPSQASSSKMDVAGVSVEEVVEYAFLKADFDFVSAQAKKKDDDIVQAERPLNDGDILHSPSICQRPTIGGPNRFKGGSTCSIAMISTPTPTPFWHATTPSSLLVSHVGDTRVLLCSTATGMAIPLTTDHHPSSPIEGTRLRRYAATFVTDSFGEERIAGLANTRSFGDIHSKRIGVSAEPQFSRIEMGPAEYSFLVLMTDGVSGTLHDQEIVDIIKEAKTPDQGASDVVSFSTEVSNDGDNATCLVVRLGGWERRLEGGLGSMGTKETRDWRRQEASVPRGRRQ